MSLPYRWSVAIAISLLLLFGCAGEPAPDPVPTPTPQPGEPVTIELSAQNGRFDNDTLAAPAGSEVTVVFNNLDSDSHNFALYESSAATTAIFVGEIIMGPDVIEYVFTAPESPGEYFFRCDPHPFTMTGTFVVS